MRNKCVEIHKFHLYFYIIIQPNQLFIIPKWIFLTIGIAIPNVIFIYTNNIKLPCLVIEDMDDEEKKVRSVKQAIVKAFKFCRCSHDPIVRVSMFWDWTVFVCLFNFQQ